MPQVGTGSRRSCQERDLPFPQLPLFWQPPAFTLHFCSPQSDVTLRVMAQTPGFWEVTLPHAVIPGNTGIVVYPVGAKVWSSESITFFQG